MENGKPPLEPALRALTARLESQLGEHSSPETLTAYHEGRLVGEEGERLHDHLALCADCAQLLLDLTAFPEIEIPAGTRRPTEGEVDDAWQAMRGRLAGEGDEAAAPVAKVLPLRQPPPVAPRRAYWAWALAASWIAVVGLGVWVVELKRENVRLAEPDGNVTVADLRAVGDTTRGGGEPGEPLPAARHLVLHLAAAGLPSHPGYEVEIRENGDPGRVAWTGRAERDPEENDFTVDLPRGFLRPGRYEIHLYGSGAGSRLELAQYTFQVGAS